MHFQSTKRKLSICMKPGRFVMDGNGVRTPIPGVSTKFQNFKYKPRDKEEEEFLDEYIKTHQGKVWKVKDEDVKMGKEYAKELEILNTKFREKKKALLELEGVQEAGTGAKVLQGVVGTGQTEKFDSELLDEKNKPINTENWKEQKEAELRKTIEDEMGSKEKDEVLALKKTIAEQQERLDAIEDIADDENEDNGDDDSESGEDAVNEPEEDIEEESEETEEK